MMNSDITDILDTLALNKYLAVEIPGELVAELEPLMPDNYFLQTINGRTTARSRTSGPCETCQGKT